LDGLGARSGSVNSEALERGLAMAQRSIKAPADSALTDELLRATTGFVVALIVVILLITIAAGAW
jgi:hypothetical protein